ncbi:hypothetical protein BCS42_11620 [Crenothrix sp. D3]|jgi:hypothetical protein|nr:hypothetical protein BCS42_11620 [Crenothrix sp. D3]
MSIKPEDEAFLHDMVIQLDETIRKLAIEEREITEKLGVVRVEELKEFWQQALSEEEEKFFRITLDYWDRSLIRVWAHSSRTHDTRVKVGHTLMLCVLN